MARNGRLVIRIIGLTAPRHFYKKLQFYKGQSL